MKTQTTKRSNGFKESGSKQNQEKQTPYRDAKPGNNPKKNPNPESNAEEKELPSREKERPYVGDNPEETREESPKMDKIKSDNTVKVEK